MDAIDVKILEFLRRNARINASEIGESINMSVSAVIERIKKLEATGVIKQYTVIVDHKKVEKSISAFISVRLETPKFHNEFINEVNTLAEISECHYIAGDYDFLLRIYTASTDTLTTLLNQIKSMKGVALTRTLVVLSTIKDISSVLPSD